MKIIYSLIRIPISFAYIGIWCLMFILEFPSILNIYSSKNKNFNQRANIFLKRIATRWPIVFTWQCSKAIGLFFSGEQFNSIDRKFKKCVNFLFPIQESDLIPFPWTGSHHGYLYHATEFLYTFLEANEKPDKNISLDIGACTGEPAQYIYHPSKLTFGLDVDYERYAGSETKIYDYYLGASVYNMPFKDSSINFVSSTRVMHHLNCQQALKEINRVMKKM